jgi:hypothetical protein
VTQEVPSQRKKKKSPPSTDPYRLRKHKRKRERETVSTKGGKKTLYACALEW